MPSSSPLRPFTTYACVQKKHTHIKPGGLSCLDDNDDATREIPPPCRQFTHSNQQHLTMERVRERGVIQEGRLGRACARKGTVIIHSPSHYSDLPPVLLMSFCLPFLLQKKRCVRNVYLLAIASLTSHSLAKIFWWGEESNPRPLYPHRWFAMDAIWGIFKMEAYNLPCARIKRCASHAEVICFEAWCLRHGSCVLPYSSHIGSMFSP